jgi:hypothetical protein
MPDIIQVGNISKGYTNNPLAFNIDNDAFPTLVNAYQWRGRIKRKRGTSLLGRLQRYFDSNIVSYTPGGTVPYTITFDGSGNANILTGPYSNGTSTFALQANGNIIPGTVQIIGSVGPVTYTDPTEDGYLTPTGTGGPNTINYATGAIHIPAQAGGTAQVHFFYYPDLPVLGIREFDQPGIQYAKFLAFDQNYAYNINTSSPYSIYDVSFYKNPTSGTYSGYTAKSAVTPTSWNGNDYQQFWSTNYEGALWVTNGVPNPFDATKVGMQFKPIVATTIVAGGPPARVNLQINAHGLVVGDFVFVNEVITTTGINLQTGYVDTRTDANNVIVTFPNATIATNGTGGIAQYLTSRSSTTIDCIRWYDGDPTNGAPPYTTLTGHKGWVNYMPPLSNAIYSISDLPQAIYYLVGARIILEFKDRLVFFGPVVQTSSGTPINLPDTIIWSENGTPYYTASFTGVVTAATTVFNAILVPDNQTAVPLAMFEDVTGFGGYKQAGIAQTITSAIRNEDVIILGFTSRQVRMIYTGNDIGSSVFDLFTINSEFGTQSTFSVITLDRGGISVGNRGIILTSQIASERIDLQIPDNVFQFNLINNGPERITAQRDFINEWIYFTYKGNESAALFPNQTLQYNYRDGTWAVFNESYTTYGPFRRVTGETWATIGNKYPTWSVWNDPWNAGTSTLLQPEVLGGNQQGFILVRDDGTDEGDSLYIQSISGSIITSPNHGLNEGDFIVITGTIGSVSSSVNGKLFQVGNVTQNTFTFNPGISASTYVGGGLIKRLYRPFVQTKQFPVAWGMSRKTRIGVQQYLLTTTASGQIEVQIYLSQNAASPYNFGPVIPEANSINDSLVYSDVVYTCPESTNLGLTPANTNLNLITATQQQQIWHRMSTSLLGDTVQLGFTISNEQMRTYTQTSETFTITGITKAYPAVVTVNNMFSVGELVLIDNVQGMTQINYDNNLSNPNYYQIIARSPTSITIDVDSTMFGVYTSGGTIFAVSQEIATSEIELHGFLIAVSPSQVLA